MALVSSGEIALAGSTSGRSVALELGRSATATTSLNETPVRSLAGVASGTIALSNFYGRSNRASLSYTYSTNQTSAVAFQASGLAGYVAGGTDITITVNSGVYLSSDSIVDPAIRIYGATSGDTITLVNNGYIMGRGGNGATHPSRGQDGGPAISIEFPITINNTYGSAYIGGGGGGGGAGDCGTTSGGGGAGGGAGGNNNAGLSGGGGGSIGNPGSNGTNAGIPVLYYGFGGGAGGAGGSYQSPAKGPALAGTGGGGGRIFPGTGGEVYTPVTNAGGVGGGGNSAGSSSGGGLSAGGGGGWGATGGRGGGGGYDSLDSGVGGKAVALNGYSVTWVSGDTTRVYGSVS